MAAFKDSFYDFLCCVKISGKDGQVILGENLYRAQHIYYDAIFDGLAEDIHEFYVLKSRQLGMCLDPETRVLTADLQWVPIGRISVGDEVVAVDEFAPRKGEGERKMRTAVVEAVFRRKQWAYEIELNDGRKLICSDRHRWLSRGSETTTKWRAIRPTVKHGRTTRLKLQVGSQLRWITQPWDAPTVEDGWFSGMLDGEGSHSNGNRSGASVNVSQRRGPVWDRLVKYAADRGYTAIVENDETFRESKFGRVPVPKLCFNRMDEIFRLLGQIRPTRFINWRFWEGRSLPGKNSGTGWSTITAIRLLGERELVDIQTSTGTFIAEGMVSHNSTGTRALDLFWLGMHEGLRAGVVFDTAFNTQSARAEIRETIKNLPKRLHFPKVIEDSRDRLALENDSWVSFMQAGTKNSRSGGGLGRSQGLNMVHASEISSWVNVEGVKSFQQSLSEEFEDRLYTWESTGRGYEIWYDLWEEAKNDPLTKRTVFIGWWAKDNQIIRPGDPRFALYSEEAPNKREEERIRTVYDLYGWRITKEQLAWVRWKTDPARELDDEEPEDTISNQEQAWHEDDAFQATGSTFFQADKLSAATARLANVDKPKCFKFWPGLDFVTCDMQPSRNKREVELKIWEEPSGDSMYVVAGDPAFGHNEKNNNSAVQVLRCYADGVDQVAEYASATIQPHQMAWLLWTLVGYYGSREGSQVLMICELNGPGEEVWRQYNATPAIVRNGYLRARAQELGLDTIFQRARNYIYSRSDSMGPGHAWQWKTSGQVKVQIMEAVRNYLHNGLLTVNSYEALEEARTITRDGDTIEAEGKNRDDRVFALALGVRAWDEKIRRGMIAGNRTKEAERAKVSMSMEDQWTLFQKNMFSPQALFARKAAIRRAQQTMMRRTAVRTGGSRQPIPARRF